MSNIDFSWNGDLDNWLQAPPVDEHFANVALYYPFDAVNTLKNYSGNPDIYDLQLLGGSGSVTPSMVGTGLVGNGYYSTGFARSLRTHPFTLEFWSRKEEHTLGAAEDILISRMDAGNREFYIARDATHLVVHFAANINSAQPANDLTIRVPLPISSSWSQIAVDRDEDGVIRVFINGVMVAKQTWTNGSSVNVTSAITIRSTATRDVSALDELRLTLGSNRYGSDDGHVVQEGRYPLVALVPEHWTNLSLLLNYKTWPLHDKSPNNAYAHCGYPNAQVPANLFDNMAFSSQGLAAINIDPVNGQFDFGDGDFTIETWYQDTTIGYAYRSIIHYANAFSFSFGSFNTGDEITFSYTRSDGTTATIFAPLSLRMPKSSWVHLAVQRRGNNFDFFLQGELVRTVAITGTLAVPARKRFTVGGAPMGSDFLKFFSDTRIYKGIAKYRPSGYSRPTKAALVTTSFPTLVWAPPAPDRLQYYFASDRDVFADDAGTIPCQDGDPVHRWKNIGYQANDAVQGNAGNRPIWHASGGLNNRPYLEFNRENMQFFQNVPLSNPGGLTRGDTKQMFFVGSDIDNTVAVGIIGDSDLNSRNTLYLRAETSPYVHYFRSGFRWGNAQKDVIIGAANLRSVNQWSDEFYTNAYTHGLGVLNGSAFSLTQVANGASYSATQAQLFRCTGITGGGYFDGKVHELLIYDGLININTFYAILRYLHFKYNLPWGS